MIDVQNTSKDSGEYVPVKLVTFGCIDQLQLRNKLKGIAMQKIILSTIKNHKEDISIKQILEMCNENVKNYYWVQYPFKTKNKSFVKKYEVINISEFEDYDSVYIKEKITTHLIKKCSYCGLTVKTNKLNKKRKCWRCGKGFFKYIITKYEDYKEMYKGNKTHLIKCLCNDGHLRKVPFFNKRVDFFHYANNKFLIFESKNKELTNLTFRDVIRTLIYPKALRDCGYIVDELIIVFNGSCSSEIDYAVRESFAQKFNFKIKFIPIDKYLKENGLNIQKLIVDKTENGYTYNIIKGDSEKIIIDLSKIEENWR